MQNRVLFSLLDDKCPISREVAHRFGLRTPHTCFNRPDACTKKQTKTREEATKQPSARPSFDLERRSSNTRPVQVRPDTKCHVHVFVLSASFAPWFKRVRWAINQELPDGPAGAMRPVCVVAMDRELEGSRTTRM